MRKRCSYFSQRIFVTVFLVIAFASEIAGAHPMGKFAVCHFAAIRAHRDSIKIHYVIDMAEVPTYRRAKEFNIDADGDGAYSDAELAAHLPVAVDELSRGILLEVDGTPPPLKVVDSQIQVKDGLPGLKTLWIEIELEAPFDAKAWENHSVTYEDKNFADVGGWKEIKLFGSEETAVMHSSPLSDRDSAALTNYPKDATEGAPGDVRVSFKFGPGKSDVIYGAGAAPVDNAPVGVKAKIDSKIKRILDRFDFFKFIDDKNLSPAVVALALLFAFIVGCGHALQPGHGKTLVAAYLVGTKGRASDAFKLGMIVTVTHVAAVIAMFLVLITFWSRLNPEKVYPWLGVFSGLIILAMGVWIIFRNAAGKYVPHEHDEFGRHVKPGSGHHSHSDHDHGHEHHHHHHDHEGSHHHHGEDGHGHHHDHDDAHGHDHGHHGGHSHDGEHHHDHGAKVEGGDDEGVKFSDLLALGITGGIVPCPTAIMILFVAIGLHRIVFGLMLTVAFSLGMALVLILIGLFVVKAKSFADDKITNSILPRILPYFSGAIVAMLGLGICVKGLRDMGLF